MSPELFGQLFEQIKRVVTKPIALVDDRGAIYKKFSDFDDVKQLQFRSPLTPNQRSVEVEGSIETQAVPIYLDGKLVVTVAVRVSQEDVQTIQIVTSLAELILQQFVLTHRPKPDAVDLLMSRVAFRSSTLEPEELSEQMTALGFRLDLPRAAMAVELKGFQDNYLQTLGSMSGEKDSLIEAKKRDINQSLISFFSKNQDNVVGFIGHDIFLVLKDLRDTDYGRFGAMLNRHYAEITAPLKNIHIKDVTIGVGTLATNPSGLIHSAAEALQVLKIGQKIVGPNRTHQVESLGILPLLMMGSDQQKQEFATKLFSSLDDEQLTETLGAFIAADLNLTQTASKLKIHRNTVIYRLDRIKEKLGKDPRVFTDAVELYLASLFARLYS